MATAEDFFSLVKKSHAEMVDLKFVDMLGSWQHCSFPTDLWEPDTFKEGLGFDGPRSEGGWAFTNRTCWRCPIRPRPVSIPFSRSPRSAIIANIVDPVTGKDFTRDPRHVARKAEAYLKKTGIADTCYIGPEPEFFIFDEVRYEQNQHKGYYEIDSAEGGWNTARIEGQNLGYKPSCKGGYFPVSPTDTYHDLRGEMVHEMRKVGIVVEAHHHEVATAGQSEIDMQFEAPVNLALSARNRSASIRIPMYSKSPKAKRLEFRCPDPSCNGYLAWPAMLMAMIDGIQSKISPGEPLDRDIYEMTRDEMKHMGIRTTPGSLEEAVSALEQDHAFLLKGDVFTKDLVDTWIAYKREKELDPIRLRPHPHEFYRYYDN